MYPAIYTFGGPRRINLSPFTLVPFLSKMSALLKYTRLSNLFKLSKLNTNFQVAYSHIPTRQHISIIVPFGDIVERERLLPKLQQRQIPCVCQYCTEPMVAGSTSSSPAPDFSIDAVLPNETARPLRPPSEQETSKPLSKLETLMLHLQYVNSRNFNLKLRDVKYAVAAALVEDISVTNAVLLLTIGSHATLPLPVAQKQEIVDKLWQRYKDLGLRLDTTIFYERLLAYERLKLLDQLSVIDILSDMEVLGITPNQAIYSKFLKMYCAAGDMSSASEVLQHMKNMDMIVDIVQYNYLIHGHFKAGNTRTAIELFTSIKDHGLKLNRFTHGEMLVGFARTGNTASIEKMMSGSIFNGIPIHFYTDAILILAKQGHKELADKILTANLLQCVMSNNTALVIEFLEAHLLDYAIAVHNVPDPFRDFSTFVCATDLSVHDMVRCLLKVKELHPESKSHTQVYYNMYNLQFLDRPGRMIDYITAMGKMREKIKLEFYRIPIKQFTEKMDVEGLGKAIPEIIQALSHNPEDVVQMVPMLVDAFKRMGQSPDEIADIFKEHVPALQKGRVNYLLIRQFADYSLEAAIKFVNNVDKIVITVGPQRDLYTFLREDFLPNNWKDVYTLIAAISRKVPRIMFDIGLFTPTIRMMKKDNINPEPFLNFLLDKKLKVHFKTDIETILPEIPEEMKERIRKEITITNKDGKIDDPATSSTGSMVAQMMKHLENANFEKMDKLEEDLQKRKVSITSLRVAHSLAKYYAVEKKMPEKALEYLLEYERIREETYKDSKDHFLQQSLTLQVAGLFAQDGMVDRAINVLGTFPVDELKAEFQYNGSHPTNLASVLLLCESEQQLNKLIQTIYKNRYFLCKPAMRDFIWKCFFQNVTDRENPEELGRAVDFMCDHPSDSQPNIIHSLFRSLIAQNNQTGVTLVGQKLKQHLNQKGNSDSDISVLNMLITAFMEEDKLDIATSIIETPGFVPQSSYIAWYCIYCARNNQPSNMETLYHLMKNNNKTMAKDELLFLCIKAYCNVTPQQLDAAKHVEETMYREEGVFPSPRTINYMRNVTEGRSKFEKSTVEATTPIDVAQS